MLEKGGESRRDRGMEIAKLLVLGRVSSLLVPNQLIKSPGNPLGKDFTLSPFIRNDNFHLSLSIEPTCKRIPTLSESQKPKIKHAYMLAKQMVYLNGTAFSWTIPGLAKIQDRLGIKILGGMKKQLPELAELVKEFEQHDLTNLGQLNKMEFYTQLAMSSVLIGVGQPRISPSPWDALCMGVPVSLSPIQVATDW